MTSFFFEFTKNIIVYRIERRWRQVDQTDAIQFDCLIIRIFMLYACMKKIWFFNHNWRSHNNNTYNKCKIDERETCVPGHRSVSVLEGCPGQGLLYPPLPLLVGVPEELLHLGPGSPPRLRQGRVLPLHLVRHCLLGEGLLHLGRGHINIRVI